MEHNNSPTSKVRESKSNVNCCVFNCCSYRRKNNDLSYHQFPPKGQKVLIENAFGVKEYCERREVWRNLLKKGKEVTSHVRVCSLHFKKEDFICSGWSSKKQLTTTAIPTENLPGSTPATSKQRVTPRHKQLMKKIIRIASKEQEIRDLLKTEKQLNALTGVPSFTLFQTLVSLVGETNLEGELTLQKRVFLTFIKLKLDLPYAVLSVLFGVSPQTCKKIFLSIVPLLSFALKRIQFMSKAERGVVLDCTELYLQKPKKHAEYYRGNTSVKFVIGVTPSGLVTFISCAYEGRTSDRNVFEQSGILGLLDAGQDAITVDGGFLIEELCKSFALRKGKAFSSARVHVERANRRIKRFKILTKPIPVELLPVINCIFAIACGVTNLAI